MSQVQKPIELRRSETPEPGFKLRHKDLYASRDWTLLLHKTMAMTFVPSRTCDQYMRDIWTQACSFLWQPQPLPSTSANKV